MLDRRSFLLASAAAAATSAAPAPSTTVLYGDRAVPLDKVGPAKEGDLWVRKVDLPTINDFHIKPQGACREDLCIPFPKELQRKECFNLTGFARKTGETVFMTNPASGASAKSAAPRGFLQFAHRARFRRAGPQGPRGASQRFPRQESSGGHLGQLVRLPPRSARLAESLRRAEEPEFRNRRRRAGYRRRSSRRPVVRQGQSHLHHADRRRSIPSAPPISSSTCPWESGSMSAAAWCVPLSRPGPTIPR